MLYIKTLGNRLIKRTSIENIALFTIDEIKIMTTNDYRLSPTYNITHLPTGRREIMNYFNSLRERQIFFHIYDHTRADLAQYSGGKKYVCSFTFLKERPDPTPYLLLSPTLHDYFNKNKERGLNPKTSKNPTPYVGIHILEKIWEHDWEKYTARLYKQYRRAYRIESYYKLITLCIAIMAFLASIIATILSIINFIFN